MSRTSSTSPEGPADELSGGEDGPADAAEMERLRMELERSRTRFRSIIQKTADGVMVVSAEGGGILFANEAAGRLFGRDADDLVGSPFGHPMVVGETTEIDLVRNGETVVAELRVMETEWEGEPARIASLRNITERKNAEEQARELVREQVARVEAEEAARRAEFLAEAARRLSSSLALTEVLQNVVDLVVEKLADYCVLDLVEEGDVKRFVAARDVEASQMEAVRGAPLQPEADTPQARAFRSCEPVLVPHVDDDWINRAAQDEEHLALLGVLRPRSVIFVPLDTGRECLGLLSAVSTAETGFRERDLHLATELGRQAALAIENARLYGHVEAANRAKANFLSVMSHELRTPLSAIIGYTDLIDRGVVGETNEKQSQYLGRIRASSTHLLQIIEEILAFAGTESGRESVQPVDTSLAEIIGTVVTAARPMVQETGLDFRVRVQGEGTPVHTDQRKVRQVLLNLISNAVKFTSEGYVEVRARPEGEELVFEVEDSGVGIPQDRQEAIFERFWQMEEALTRSAGGTGLGLTVARSFSSLLGGTLSVESEPQVGSTFVLRIPREIHA